MEPPDQQDNSHAGKESPPPFSRAHQHNSVVNCGTTHRCLIVALTLQKNVRFRLTIEKAVLYYRKLVITTLHYYIIINRIVRALNPEIVVSRPHRLKLVTSQQT